MHEVDTCSSSEESIYSVRNPKDKAQYFAEISIHSPVQKTTAPLRVQLDSGATCSTMKLDDYVRVTGRHPPPAEARLKVYDGTIIKPVGTDILRCYKGNISKKVRFQILEKAPTALLSGRAAEALGLMQIDHEQLVNAVSDTPSLTQEQVLQDYADVFQGLGKMPGRYHIEVDEHAKPVQNTRRRVPIPLREELKAKLHSMEEQKIIAKVEEPTPWISNMVVVKKPNKLRICLDPQHLNKAIKRNHHPIPTLDEITPRFANAKVFSVVDAKDGFLQVELDEPSSLLTTFWTPWGRRKWLRMPFGISSAPEEFERRLEECLEGLQQVAVIADDIVQKKKQTPVYGEGDTEEEADASHDKAFRALMQRCKEKNLKLNARKLKLKMASLGYMGHTISAEGLTPDAEKVRAIQDMPRPSNVQGVQRLLGLANYLAKFLPKLSTVCEPLRRLTDKKAEFDWLPHHDQALNRIKDLVTAAPVLQFYDTTKEAVIECDSSEVGLGAVLTQEGHPVAYASRALTQTERQYAQIEKECLAIVFATQRFEQYILGKEKVVILTDHKPLVSIFDKPILSCPKRLQRMRLRLQKYTLKVHYKPGPQMFISDTLSRASLPTKQIKASMPDYLIYQLTSEEKLMADIADVTNEVVHVSDVRLEQIRQNTATDVTLQTLMSLIQEGWPEDKAKVPLVVRQYWPYRDELITANGLAYRGTRVIIPTSMRPEMIKRAHASHMGLQYTVNTARDVMYWPSIHADLTEEVRQCRTCQEAQAAQPKEPLMTYPLPKHPWQIVASDCFDAAGKHYVVYVDVYSDYIEVSELEDLLAETLIAKSKQIFATHGIPLMLLSDNAPNYAAKEFADFARTWEFQHITSSPHYSKSNGRAEAAVKTMKNIVKKSGHDDMWKAVLEWRNTITPGMDTSPAQRLLSRRTRSFITGHPSLYEPQVQKEVTEHLINKRRKAKKYYDHGARSLPDLVIGQPIRAKTRPKVADSPWVPGYVKAQVAPRSFLVEVNGRDYRRNRVHLRDSADATPHGLAPLPDSDINIGSIPESQHTQTTTDNIPASPAKPATPTKRGTTRSGRVSKPPARFQDYVK